MRSHHEKNIDICVYKYNCLHSSNDHDGIDDNNMVCQTTLSEVFICQEEATIKMFYQDLNVLCEIKMVYQDVDVLCEIKMSSQIQLWQYIISNGVQRSLLMTSYPVIPDYGAH